MSVGFKQADNIGFAEKAAELVFKANAAVIIADEHYTFKLAVAGVLTQQGIVYITWAACAVKLCGIVASEFVIGLFGDIAELVIICVDAGIVGGAKYFHAFLKKPENFRRALLQYAAHGHIYKGTCGFFVGAQAEQIHVRAI